MSFTVPTLDELHQFVVALGKAQLPELDWSQSSFPWLFTRTLCGAATDNHANLISILGDLLPDTAEGVYLDRWGTILGRARKAATPARKADALRITGTPGSTVNVGDELTHQSQLRFQVNQFATIPAGGEIDVDVVAIDTGSATRLNAGEVLTFTSPPSGVNAETELQLALDEDGDDQEQDGAYRLRILNRLSQPALGGAQNDYVQWALEVTGVASAYAYPNRNGLGTVDVAALHTGSGTARVLSAGEVAELQAYIDGKRPVASSVRVLEVVAASQDVEVQVVTTGESAYEFDWNDQTPPTVSAWNGTTRELTFTAARPSTMKAGDRIIIKTTAGDGRQHVIESLVSTDKIILEESPTVAPVATNPVYSGGPVVDPVRDAVIALMDGLGTANPDSVRYGAWNGSLRLASLATVVNAVEGVLDSVLADPVANVDAVDNSYPTDHQIGLLIPRRIIARKKW